VRIALFSEVYWPMVSGVGVTLVRLVDGLHERGHEVRVYSASYALPEGERERPEAHRSPSIPLFLYPDVQWAFPRLRDVMDDAVRFRPDIVHVATEFSMGVAGLKTARQLRVPLIASAHTDYERYAARYGMDWVLRWGWRYLRWFYGQAGRVLCPSRIYEEHLHRRGVYHTGVWGRGVDPREFSPRFRSEAYRVSLGLGPDDLLVSYIGRLAREKNLDLLMRAWPELRARHPRAQLLLVGRGPLEEELRRSEIPGVHVPGLMRGEPLAAAYASSDLFVFPSTTETFGNSLLEAMASALPCVVAASGGVLEFARHGENAWLVAPNREAALLEGVGRLMDDGALRRQLADGARATAAARGWDAIYDRLLEDYAQVIARRRGARAA
jgi:glycosyltransferase involved in cell wall biosynthesis